MQQSSSLLLSLSLALAISPTRVTLTCVSKSASSFPGAKRCAGDSFCHCKVFASAAALKVPLPSAHEFQRITRQVRVRWLPTGKCRLRWLTNTRVVRSVGLCLSQSLSLSDEESAHLENFGAHAEAALAVSAAALRANTDDAFTKLLQRRIFMLQSTLWNPKSDAFKLKKPRTSLLLARVALASTDAEQS